MRKIKKLLLHCAVLSYLCGAACGQTATAVCDVSFDRLSSVAATGTVSSSDIIGYAVVSRYYYYTMIASSEEIIGNARKRNYDALINIFTTASENNGWESSEAYTASLSGWCLGGLIEHSNFGQSILAQAKTFNGLYAGTNPIVRAAIEWQEGGCSNLPPVFSESWFSDLTNRPLSELSNRDTGILEAFFAMEFLWRNRVEAYSETRELRNQTTAWVLSEINERVRKHGDFKFQNSNGSAFRDTCIALILLNGHSGIGAIRSQSWPLWCDHTHEKSTESESVQELKAKSGSNPRIEN